MRGHTTPLQIRSARAADHAVIVRLFEQLASGDPPPTQAVFERDMLRDTLIATDDAGAEVLGYAYWQVLGHACYVRHLVTSPDHRRRGVASALLLRIASAGRARSASSWMLNVKVDNHPALRLYESLGFERSYECVVVRMPWAAIARLPDAAAAIETRAPEPAEHAFIEEVFDLAPGLVERSARGAGKLLRIATAGPLLSSTSLLAFTSFDGSFPGAFPFRARTVAAAQALLGSLLGHAREIDDPDRPWRRDSVQLGIEDAPEVSRNLLASGGTEVFRIAHLRGALPVRPG